MNKFSEDDIKTLGFVLSKQYNHNQYNTNRYKKGVIEVEFTYEASVLKTIDLTLEEINCLPITKKELHRLDCVFNKPTPKPDWFKTLKLWITKTACKLNFHKKETFTNTGVVNSIPLSVDITKCKYCNKVF